MDQNQQNSLEDEDETGLAGLVVPAPSSEPDRPEAPISPPTAPYGAPIETVVSATSSAVVIDPLAADRAARIAEIRAEAATREAEAAKAGKPIVEKPQAPAALLAAAEERQAAEARATSPMKISSNPQDVLPTQEEILERRQAQAAARQAQQPAGPVNVQTDPRYEGKTWEEVVAIRQEEARIRRHNKELAEKESNQQKKEDFRARVLAARQPETTVHRPQPTAPAISEQTRLEMEAGRKRSEEYHRARGAVVLPTRR